MELGVDTFGEAKRILLMRASELFATEVAPVVQREPARAAA